MLDYTRISFKVYLFLVECDYELEVCNFFTKIFPKAQLEKLSNVDLENPYAINTDNSIFVINTGNFDYSRQLKYYSDRLPIIWLSNMNHDSTGLELFTKGIVHNLCLISKKEDTTYTIIRELRAAQTLDKINVLKEQSTLLTDLALSTTMAVLTANPKGEVIWVNKAHSEISGYSLDEMIGKKPGKILQGPLSNPDTIKKISENLRKQIPFSEEIVNYHKNGTPYWIRLNITPIFKNGKLDKFISFQENITKEVKNKLELEDSLSNLIESQRIGKLCSWVLDKNTFKIEWSSNAHEILDIKDSESLTYSTFRTYLSDASRSRLHKEIQKVIRHNSSFDIILEYFNDNKKKKIIRVVGNPPKRRRFNGKIQGIIQDITDQYLSELNASSTLQHLNSITSSMEAGVARILDLKNGEIDILFANEGYYSIYEIPEREAKKDFTLIHKLTHPDDFPLGINDIYEIVKQTGKAFNQYFRIITSTGKIKWLHLNSRAEKTEAGDLIHDLIVTDISDRKHKDKLFEEISQVSQNGGWELDLITNKLKWTSVTKMIHEVPEDFEPNPETAINFYKEGKSRESIIENFTKLISKGIDYDGRHEIVTAKGNLKWVRAKGTAEYAGDRIVRVYGIFQDITALVQRETHVLESLNEKNALLGEIHHRVKNNLAVISGLLQLELMKGDDAKLSLEDAVNRIQSIATVHEILYSTDNFSVIYLDKYLEKLTLNIAKTNPSFISDIKLITNMDHVGISINQAVPVGLLLNELITNSLKHAFNGINNGSISISVSNVDDTTVKIQYSDSGAGFDDKLLNNGSSLGYKLINSLLLQLEATHTIETKDGFKLECTFQSEEIDDVQLSI